MRRETGHLLLVLLQLFSTRRRFRFIFTLTSNQNSIIIRDFSHWVSPTLMAAVKSIRLVSFIKSHRPDWIRHWFFIGRHFKYIYCGLTTFNRPSKLGARVWAKEYINGILKNFSALEFSSRAQYRNNISKHQKKKVWCRTVFEILMNFKCLSYKSTTFELVWKGIGGKSNPNNI